MSSLYNMCEVSAPSLLQIWPSSNLPRNTRQGLVDHHQLEPSVLQIQLSLQSRTERELIDPAELPIDSHVRSPSGRLLAPEQFLVHPDRPLSIRERQEEIREKVRTASRLGVEAETVEETVAVRAKKVVSPRIA